MSASEIFINFKKYLQSFGYEVLDYIIQPVNLDETDPYKRYENFDVQFNEHFGTSEHFQINHGVNFPFLAMDVTPETSANGGFQRYVISFAVYYSTVSPPAGRVCIENTPEGKLEYRDGIYCAIKKALVHRVKSVRSGLKPVTFAQDVAAIEDWYLPISIAITDIGDLQDFDNEVTDEVEMFAFPVTLSQYICMPYNYKRRN